MALADLMVPALARLGLKSKALQVQLMNHWPAVVGDMVAEHTAVSLFHRGRLTVTTDSPAMSHALKMQLHDIIGRLNERMGGDVVTSIHFRLAKGRP